MTVCTFCSWTGSGSDMCNFWILPLNRRSRPLAASLGLSPEARIFRGEEPSSWIVSTTVTTWIGVTSWQESGPLMLLQTGPASQTQTFKQKNKITFFLSKSMIWGGGKLLSVDPFIQEYTNLHGNLCGFSP